MTANRADQPQFSPRKSGPDQQVGPTRRRAASEPGASSARLYFLSPVARERRGILLRLCRKLDNIRAQGGNLSAAYRETSARWHGRPYRAEPGQRLRLSWETLRRIYKGWRKSGHSAACLNLDYGRARRFRLNANQLSRIFQSLPLALSIQDLHRAVTLGGHGPQYRTVLESISPADRTALKTLFRHRRARLREERALVRKLLQPGRLLYPEVLS